MKIAIGSDHAGYARKQEVISFLHAQNYEVNDFGPFNEDSVDYPDFAHPVAAAVESGEYNFGILLCGSGEGVCITANKHWGIRAALAWLPEIAALSRRHNDANVLCLPARFISAEEAIDMVKVFLETAFEGGRHERRVEKIAL